MSGNARDMRARIPICAARRVAKVHFEQEAITIRYLGLLEIL